MNEPHKSKSQYQRSPAKDADESTSQVKAPTDGTEQDRLDSSLQGTQISLANLELNCTPNDEGGKKARTGTSDHRSHTSATCCTSAALHSGQGIVFTNADMPVSMCIREIATPVKSSSSAISFHDHIYSRENIRAHQEKKNKTPESHKADTL